MENPEVQIVTESGLYALIKFAHNSHYCGYVLIEEDNKLYAMSYENPMVYNLNVHGGITFAGKLDDKYYIGFDCAHAGDLMMIGDPSALESIYHIHREYKNTVEPDVFRDYYYCRDQVESLAHQISEFQMEAQNK